MSNDMNALAATLDGEARALAELEPVTEQPTPAPAERQEPAEVGPPSSRLEAVLDLGLGLPLEDLVDDGQLEAQIRALSAVETFSLARASDTARRLLGSRDTPTDLYELAAACTLLLGGAVLALDGPAFEPIKLELGKNAATSSRTESAAPSLDLGTIVEPPAATRPTPDLAAYANGRTTVERGPLLAALGLEAGYPDKSAETRLHAELVALGFEPVRPSGQGYAPREKRALASRYERAAAAGRS